MAKKKKQKLYVPLAAISLASLLSLGSAKDTDLSERTSIRRTPLERIVDFSADAPNPLRDAVYEEHRQYREELARLAGLDYRTDDFRKDSIPVLGARLLLGECYGGCSREEKAAIVWTAINRYEKYPQLFGVSNLRDAILYPFAYSSFNSDRNEFLKDPKATIYYDEFIRNIMLVREILNGEVPDPTGGATNYFRRGAQDLADVEDGIPPWFKDFEYIGFINGSFHEFMKPRDSSS